MKKVRIFLWLPNALREKFKKKCKENGITMSRKLIDWIEKWVNE